MVEDGKDGLEEGKNKAGRQALSLEEKERILGEMQKILDRFAQGGGVARCDPDGRSYFSFGLGIDPNG